MLGYEYEFTKLLIKDFWYVPDAPQPFCEAVDWEPVLAGLHQRVEAKLGRKIPQSHLQSVAPHQHKRTASAPMKAPINQVLHDELLGQFGL